METLQKKLDARDRGSFEDNENKVGLVIESDIINRITESAELEKQFNDIADRLDIVLACRIAPK